MCQLLLCAITNTLEDFREDVHMVEGLEILTRNYELFATFAMPHMFWEYDENGVPSRLRDGEFLPFIEADQIPLV